MHKNVAEARVESRSHTHTEDNYRTLTANAFVMVITYK